MLVFIDKYNVERDISIVYLKGLWFCLFYNEKYVLIVFYGFVLYYVFCLAYIIGFDFDINGVDCLIVLFCIKCKCVLFGKLWL